MTCKGSFQASSFSFYRFKIAKEVKQFSDWEHYTSLKNNKHVDYIAIQSVLY